VDTDVVPYELQNFEGEQTFETYLLEAKACSGGDWQRWVASASGSSPARATPASALRSAAATVATACPLRERLPSPLDQ